MPQARRNSNNAKPTAGLLSSASVDPDKKIARLEARSASIKDPYAPGGSRYTGYYRGLYWVQGDAERNITGTTETKAYQDAMAAQSLVMQNRAEQARAREGKLLNQQLNKQNAYYDEQLNLSRQQAANTEGYLQQYLNNQQQTAALYQEQQKTAETLANNAEQLSQQTQSRTGTKIGVLQSQARARYGARQKGRRARFGGLISSRS